MLTGGVRSFPGESSRDKEETLEDAHLKSSQRERSKVSRSCHFKLLNETEESAQGRREGGGGVDDRWIVMICGTTTTSTEMGVCHKKNTPSDFADNFETLLEIGMAMGKEETSAEALFRQKK